MRRKNIWNELDLLCRIGVGLEAIAPDVSRLVRELVGADAVAIFWLDEIGMPAGFFHEDSPASIRELFLNEFDRLFVGEREINIFSLAQNTGARVGHLIAPDHSYYQSNTFNLLVRPSGHHHALDLRVDIRGQARAVVLLFRTQGTAFGEEQAILLDRVAPYLQRALSPELAESGWRGDTDVSAHMLVDIQGRQILMCSEHAAVLLGGANLVGAGLSLTGDGNAPPKFVRELCERIRLGGHGMPSPTCSFSVPGGRLRATAVRLRTPGAVTGPSSSQILVMLEFLRPASLDTVRKVVALEVSPLQREIALKAGLGHARSDCTASLGVSNEALKKHLRVIYAAAGVSNWEELASVLDR